MPSTISGTVQELLVHKDKIILALEKENAELNKSNAELKSENKTLKTKIEFARGRHIEKLIKEWTEGTLTKGKSRYDVTTKNGTRLETKWSEVHTQETGVRRWNWSSILGWNKTKIFDYLVLAGAKDPSYQYPDLLYVLFLIPQRIVNDIKCRGNSLALNTNLDINRANTQNLTLLKPYLVRVNTNAARGRDCSGRRGEDVRVWAHAHDFFAGAV